jgi:uncharacterized protein with HEPN domain
MKDDLIPLHDILTEIAFLQSICDRNTLETFRQNPADIRAASFSILIISEAARRIPDEWLAAYPDIPWHAIRAIGNKLRHEYQRISETILWGIVSTHADALKVTIEDILAARGGEH